jgi:hypothetical protein
VSVDSPAALAGVAIWRERDTLTRGR